MTNLCHNKISVRARMEIHTRSGVPVVVEERRRVVQEGLRLLEGRTLWLCLEDSHKSYQLSVEELEIVHMGLMHHLKKLMFD